MTTSEFPSSFLLQGDVLQIGFHRVGKAPYPEDIAPGGVLRALAQYMQVDLQTQGVFWGDYCYFAGVTGEAFRFLELMGLGKAEPGTPLVERYGQMTMATMYHQALEAAGLVSRLHLKPDLPQEPLLRHQIVESLCQRQCPVIGFGVFGPPEPFLITGYAEDGEILLGWSHFQGDREGDADLSLEPSGQFRLRNWYRAIDGVAVVTGTGHRPPAREIYREALARGMRELATTGAARKVLGMAAMEAWAGYLENDAAFAEYGDTQWQKAHSDHGGTAGDLAERRALAASFLELACRFLPEAEADLELAGASFMGAHDTVYEIWETVAGSGPFDPDLEKFRDPERRRAMAALVRRLAQLDRRGLAFLERAMGAIDGRPGPAIAPDPVLDGTVALTKAELPGSAQPRWAPQNIAMPNMMSMVRAFLGETVAGLSDYPLWMGLSGAAFGMLSDGPEHSNLELLFDALGYDYELWMSQQLADETGLPCRRWGWDDNLRRRIFWNLRDRRLPVLLFNCGPWPDWWLVTRAERWGNFHGYGGNSGEGYRPNEPLDHPKNPLRAIDLFAGMKDRQTWTISLLTRRTTPRPSLAELYERAITWGAASLGRQRMRILDAQGAEYVSTQPYGDWARMLETDSLFPADDIETLKERRQRLEGDEVELAERRFYGAGFLEAAATHLERPQLDQAAARMRHVNALMEQVWAQLGGMHAPEAHLRLGDVGVRRAIAGLLREMEGEDAATAALLTR